MLDSCEHRLSLAMFLFEEEKQHLKDWMQWGLLDDKMHFVTNCTIHHFSHLLSIIISKAENRIRTKAYKVKILI